VTLRKGWLIRALREAKRDAAKWPDLTARVKAGTGEFSLRRRRHPTRFVAGVGGGA